MGCIPFYFSFMEILKIKNSSIFTDQLKNIDPEDPYEILANYLSDYNIRPVNSALIHAFDGQNNRNKHYHVLEIPKKRGGMRIISVPEKQLKSLQKILLRFLCNNYEPHKTATGFVSNKSIVDNARLHSNKKYIFCLDIEDFFPTIHWGRVNKLLQAYPFNLSANIARIIANLTTYNGSLPQGAPTSPFLANMICRKLDSRLYAWATKNQYMYSRYADDITLSTNKPQILEKEKLQIENTIVEEGFKINSKKTRVMPYYKRQIVTGLVCNNRRPTLPRELFKNMRALFHNIENYNLKSQLERLELKSLPNFPNRPLNNKEFYDFNKYQSEHAFLIRRSIMFNGKNFHSAIKGLLSFIKMVEGKESIKYLRLAKRYELIADPVKALMVGFTETAEKYRTSKTIIENGTSIEEIKGDLKKYFNNQIAEIDWIDASNDPDRSKKQLLSIGYNALVDASKLGIFWKSFTSTDGAFKNITHSSTTTSSKDNEELFQSCKEDLERYCGTYYMKNELKTITEEFIYKFQAFIVKNVGVDPRDRSNQFWKDHIIKFRTAIRFDDDRDSYQWSSLFEQMNKVIKDSNTEHEILFTHSTGTTMHTYTENVRKALLVLAESLSSNSISRDEINLKIELDKKNDAEGVMVSISIAKAVINANHNVVDIFGTKMKEVLRLLRGLADWEIIANFLDGTYIVDVMKNSSIETENKIEGITHKLFFYQ